MCNQIAQKASSVQSWSMLSNLRKVRGLLLCNMYWHPAVHQRRICMIFLSMHMIKPEVFAKIAVEGQMLTFKAQASKDYKRDELHLCLDQRNSALSGPPLASPIYSLNKCASWYAEIQCKRNTLLRNVTVPLIMTLLHT